jgi:hypothetical protein
MFLAGTSKKAMPYNILHTALIMEKAVFNLPVSMLFRSDTIL